MKDDTELNFFFDFLDSDAENESQKEKFRLKEGERREVCILFADVKNSTVMGSQLDPEAFQSKLDPLMKRFTKCITYYGGYVDKYLGDGIMALFGAKQATEQDTVRAVLAGLKMIEQLELYNRKLNNELPNHDAAIGIRIGINTGLVVVGKVGEEREGDFTVTGAAVHLAQRMETNAPVGKILLPVQAMQAVERFFEFELFGHVQAKGFATPVESYTVLRPRLEKGQRWFRRKAVYIGREAELLALDKAFAHLERKLQGIEDGSSAPSIIAIKGDAGLGKTRLVHEFCLAHQNRMKLISCAASGIVHTPFYLFINLLESEFKLSSSEPISTKKQKLEEGFKALIQNLDDAEAAELTDSLPLIGALLEIPYPDSRLKQSGQELLLHLRLAMQNLIKQILLQHSKAGLPIVLVLDDLHWMDESSAAIFANLLQALGKPKSFSAVENRNSPPLLQTSGKPNSSSAVENRSSPPLLLILQYRTDYALPSEIVALDKFKELELSPLSDVEMLRLLKHHTADFTVPEDVIAKVKLLSMGNPFYLEEWCNYLGDLQHKDLSDLPIPANLHALILSRLDMLDTSIRLLLQKAAVIGQEFFVDILSWIEDKLYNPIDVSGTLAHLEQQAFILKLIGFDYSAYFFKHITTRDVAYQTLLLENRAILHKLAAEAIEDLYPQRQQEFLFPLADHYHRAAVPEKAIFYLEKAAAAAERVYSNRQAIELYEKLLAWVLESGKVEKWKSEKVEEEKSGKAEGWKGETGCITPARILIHLTEIKSLIGKWDEADSDLQQAFTYADNPHDHFDCHRLKGISSFRRGNMETALTEWQTCLEIATSQPLNVVPATSSVVPAEAGIQPLPTLQPSNLPTTLLAAAHNNLGIWYQHHKDYDQALHHHHTSLNYAQELNDTLRIAKTLSNLGFMYLTQKDYPNAEKHLSECLAIAEANQYLQLMSIALGNLGILHYKQGNLDQAMHFYEKKWLLVDKLDDKAELIKVLGNIANVHREKVQHREALEYYRKVLMLKESQGNEKEIAITHNAIANELRELDRLPEALIELDKAIDYASEYPYNLCEYLYNKADTLLSMRDFKNAATVNKRAFEVSKEVNRIAVIEACKALELQINFLH